MAGRPEPRPAYSRTFSSGYETYQPNHRDDSRWDSDRRPPTGPRAHSIARPRSRSPSPRARPEHVTATAMQNQKKRKASRSPDSAAPNPPKQSAHYPPSRKVSVQTNPGALSDGVSHSLLKENRLPVQSPSSITSGRSFRQDDSSSRSTPQPQQTALATTNGQAVAIVSDPDSTDALHSSVARTASLQNTLQIYREQLKRFEAEDTSFKGVYATNPSTKSTRAKWRSDKLKQIETCEVQLAQQKATEQEMWQAMWHSLKTPHDAKLLAEVEARAIMISTGQQSRADTVTRAEYETLEKSNNDLKAEQAELKAMLVSLQKKIGGVEEVASRADRNAHGANTKTGQVPSMQSRIQILENKVSTEAADANSISRLQERENTDMQSRLKAVERAIPEITSVQLDVKALEVIVRDNEKLCSKVNDLINSSIAFSNSEISRLSHDVGSIVGKVDSCTTACLDNSGAIKKLENVMERGLSSYRTENEEIKTHVSASSKRLDQLETSAPKDLSNETRAATDESDTFKHRLLSVHEQVVQLEGRFDLFETRVENEVFEQGKPSVVKRLKKHDQHINNFSSQIEKIVVDAQPKTVKRVEKLEADMPKNLRRIEKLEADITASVKLLQELKGKPAVAPQRVVTPSESDTVQRIVKLEADLLSFRNILNDFKDRPATIPQVVVGTATPESENTSALAASIQSLKDDIDQRFEGLEEETSAKETIVGNELQKLYTELSASITSLDDRFKQQLESEVASVNQRYDAKSEDLTTAIAANQQAIGILEAKSLSAVAINEKLQMLERRSTAPAPIVVNGPPQFKPTSRASPAVQSPRTGSMNSPQVNGFHAPSPGPTNLELKGHFDALSGFVNHLKQRIDNLTTDEVVKLMVGQMREMYPAAGDFQAAVMQLSQADKELRANVTRLDARITSVWEATRASCDAATVQSISAQKTADEAKAAAGDCLTQGSESLRRLTEVEHKLLLQQVANTSVSPAPQQGTDNQYLKRVHESQNEQSKQTAAINTRLQKAETLIRGHDKYLATVPDKLHGIDAEMRGTLETLTKLATHAENSNAIAAKEQAQTKQLAGSLAALENAHNTTVGSITSLEQMKPKLEKVLEGLEHTSSLAQFLEDEVTEIKTLPQRVSVVEKSVSDVKKSVSVMEKSAEELQSAKGELAEQFTIFDVRMESLVESTGELIGRFNRLETERGVGERIGRAGGRV